MSMWVSDKGRQSLCMEEGACNKCFSCFLLLLLLPAVFPVG